MVDLFQYQAFAAPLETGGPASTPQLGWRPSFPDWIACRRLTTAAQMAFSGPPRASYDFKWLPRYPDTVPRRRVLTALQTAFWTGHIRPTAPPLVVWLPIYPDWLARRVPAEHATGQVVFGPVNPLVFPPPSQEYRREADPGIRRQPQFLPAATFNPEPIPNPPPAEGYPAGMTVYPDQIAPKTTLGTAAQLPVVFYVIPLLPDYHSAWQGSYLEVPFPVPRLSPAVSQGGAVVIGDDPTLGVLSWQPQYPDRIAAHARQPALLPAPSLEIGYLVLLAGFDWRPVEARVVRREVPRLATGVTAVLQPPSTLDVDVILLAQDHVTAPVLLDVLTEPVLTPEVLTQPTFLNEELV